MSRRDQNQCSIEPKKYWIVEIKLIEQHKSWDKKPPISITSYLFYNHISKLKFDLKNPEEISAMFLSGLRGEKSKIWDQRKEWICKWSNLAG